MSPKYKISAVEKTRIAERSCTALRTVDRCYAGERVRGTTHKRVSSTASELGLPAPPEPTDASHAA